MFPSLIQGENDLSTINPSPLMKNGENFIAFGSNTDICAIIKPIEAIVNGIAGIHIFLAENLYDSGVTILG